VRVAARCDEPGRGPGFFREAVVEAMRTKPRMSVMPALPGGACRVTG